MAKGEIVRVVRVVEYIGPRGWVEETVKNSIHGARTVRQGEIRAVTLGEFPQEVKVGEANIAEIVRVAVYAAEHSNCMCGGTGEPEDQEDAEDTSGTIEKHNPDCPFPILYTLWRKMKGRPETQVADKDEWGNPRG